MLINVVAFAFVLYSPFGHLNEGLVGIVPWLRQIRIERDAVCQVGDISEWQFLHLYFLLPCHGLENTSSEPLGIQILAGRLSLGLGSL